MNKTSRIWLLIFTVLLAAAPFLPALEIPALRGRVNDYADMISSAVESLLDQKLRALEESDSTQVVILTIPSLEDESLEEYSIRVAETWGIGQKEYDNGALLFVSKNDRKVRIEVGYGLEGVLTDLLAGRIIDYEIVPNFKAGRFDKGFVAGIEAITRAVKGEYQGTGTSVRRSGISRIRGGVMPFIVLIIILSILGSKRRIIGGIGGALLLPLVAWFALPFGLAIILFMIPFGFLGGLILPGMFLYSGRRGFGGGMGGFGGGASGGFGGGGGGFGGGGASGGW